MNKTTKLLLPFLVALSLLAAPAVALAQTGPVHQVLAGTVFDPAATNLRIVPPKGGMVLVYRDGKAVGWLMRAGYLTVKPNRLYGVVATRGTTMLFNAGLMVRPGLTELVWKGDSTPQMSYLPSYYGYANQPATHHHSASPAKQTTAYGAHHASSRVAPRALEGTATTTHKAVANKLRRAKAVKSPKPAKQARKSATANKRLVSAARLVQPVALARAR